MATSNDETPAIIGALERAAARLDAEADQLATAGDYSAELPSEDARMIREAVRIVQAQRTDHHERHHDRPDGVIAYTGDGHLYAYCVEGVTVTWCCRVGGDEITPGQMLTREILEDHQRRK